MVIELKIPTSEVELSFPKGLTTEEFEALCFANKELVIEREPNGKITVMSPVSVSSGDNEAEFIADLKIYVRQHGGKSFSSSTGFTLPDSSVKSPDASFVSAEKMALVSKEELNHFAAIVPDFIVEVISPSDNLKDAMSKMTDVWIANGVALGWLVDVNNERLWIYRQNGSVDLIESFERTLDGEDIVPGFEFDLRNLM
ncbi:MAG: Uma2 family endonuclease [Neolewinella sp.]|jgi:Uma2 family endonuclease